MLLRSSLTPHFESSAVSSGDPVSSLMPKTASSAYQSEYDPSIWMRAARLRAVVACAHGAISPSAKPRVSSVGASGRRMVTVGQGKLRSRREGADDAVRPAQ